MFWKLCCSMLLISAAVGSLQGVDGHGYHQVQRRSVRKAASIGGSKIMECDINYPEGRWMEHIIQWRKQGIEVPIFIQFNGYPPHIDAGYQTRIRLVEQASIELRDIRVDDEGWYECSIVFLDGGEENTNGTWIYLSVNSPPVLGGVSPSFLIQKEGDTVEMFCEASATPEPTLTWFKDGKELPATRRVTMEGNKVEIRSLVRADGGVYTCTFKNIVGQVSHIIKLVIEGNAYIMVPPKNVTSPEGSRVKLTCQAEGYPNNITYHWYKNGEDVQSVSGLMERAGVYTDGSFTINSVVKLDTGWYKCRPSNGLGPAPEAIAYLNVTYLPRVISMPVRIYLPKGMEGRITCPVEANPPVTLVMWTKNERVLDFSNTERLRLSKDGTLVFRKVQATDEGRYSCTPYSALGAGRISSVTQLIVRDPPYFLIRPNQYYQRQPTQSVVMPCAAEGDPPPAITWRKADGTFPADNKVGQDGGNLTITNLGKEDHGQYECVATNMVTSVVTSTLLIIELTTPHAPYNITVETTQISAKISWRPAYDGGFPQHYILWYKMQNGGREEWQTLRVVPDEATSLTIYHLFPNAVYQFSVLSRNRLGDGMFSEIVTAKTKGHETVNHESTPYPPDPKPDTLPRGPKPWPPRNVTVRDQQNGLLITWQAPSNQTVPVLTYEIKFRTVGRWVELQRGINKNWFLWRTASRGARYYFQVYSHSLYQVSEPSNVASIVTGDPMAEGPSISGGLIGGVVGGLLFLFVIIILAVIAYKFFNKKRQRERAMRYGNVKYFGPKQVEANKKNVEPYTHEADCEVSETSPTFGTAVSVRSLACPTESIDETTTDEFDRSGRGGFVNDWGIGRWGQRIFTLQANGDDDFHENITPLHRPHHFHAHEDSLFTRHFFGNLPDKSRKVKQRGVHYEVDYAHPLEKICRTADGRFVLDDTYNQDHGYVQLEYNVNDVISGPHVKFPGDRRYASSVERHQPYEIDFGPNQEDSVFTDFAPRRATPSTIFNGCSEPWPYVHHPPFPGDCQRPMVPSSSQAWYNYLPESSVPTSSQRPQHWTAERQATVSRQGDVETGLQGHFNPSFRDSEAISSHDGVIMRPPLPPSDKTAQQPNLNRTYMTSSPDAEGYSQPFIVSDISSVVPSSGNASHSNRSNLPSIWGSGLESSSFPQEMSSIPAETTVPQLSLSNVLPTPDWEEQLRYGKEIMGLTSPDLEPYFRPLNRRSSEMPRGGVTEMSELDMSPWYTHRGDGDGEPLPFARGQGMSRIMEIRQNNKLPGSKESSPEELAYTRDRLGRAVEKVRERGVQTTASPLSQTSPSLVPTNHHTFLGSHPNVLDRRRSWDDLRNNFPADHFDVPCVSHKSSVKPSGISLNWSHPGGPAMQQDVGIHEGHAERDPLHCFAHNVAPYVDYSPARRTSLSSSGRGSGSGTVARGGRCLMSQTQVNSTADHSPDSTNLSSGLGSRDTSSSAQGHSGSGPSQAGHGYRSLSSSGATQTDQDLSNQSEWNGGSGYPSTHMHNQPASGDENYEFDETRESELLDALRQYSSPSVHRSGAYSSKSPGGQGGPKEQDAFLREPKARHGDKNEERCAKLREEYLAFQCHSQDDSIVGTFTNDMESEML